MLRKRLRFFLFFPSATFNLLPAEIFPYGLLYFLFNFRVSHQALLLTLFAGLCGSLPILFNYHLLPTQYVISVASFLNALAILIIKKDNDIVFFRRLLVFYLSAVLAVSFIQWTSILGAVNWAIQMIIPRGAMTPLNDVRGVTSLSSEPSRAAYEFYSVLFALCIGKYLLTKKIMRPVSLFLIAGFAFFLMNKSLTGLFVFIMMVGVMVTIWLTPLFRMFVIIITIIMAVLIGPPLLQLLAIDRLEGLNSASSLSDVLNWLLTQAFHRVPVIQYSVIYLYHHPFGSGFGNFEMAQLAYQPGENLFTNRLPFGFQIMLETGIFCFLFLSTLLIVSLAKKGLFYASLPLLFVLLLLCDPGNPIPFASLVYLFMIAQSRKTKE